MRTASGRKDESRAARARKVVRVLCAVEGGMGEEVWCVEGGKEGVVVVVVILAKVVGCGRGVEWSGGDG